MQRFLRQLFAHLPSSAKRWQRPLGLLFVLCISAGIAIALTTPFAQAQNSDRDVKKLEDRQIQQFSLPSTPPEAPVYKPRPAPPAPAKSSPPKESPKQEAAPPAPEPPAAEAPAPAPQPPRRSNQQQAPAPAPESEPEPESTPVESAKPEVPASIAVDDKTPTSQYVLEFNRSPVVGDRFRLQGLYSEARLGFTRPRNWKVTSAKAAIRFQHSPALLASRSNLTVRINGTSIGSVPLNRPQSQVGTVIFNIPPDRIGDYNDISIVAQQHNASDCKDEEPNDQTLWTEVLPDSKLIFNYKPQPIALNFSRYPYPFFDDLSLEPNQIAYLQPRQLNESWLTAAARYQATLGRLADFRPLETSIVKGLDQVQVNERLVIIGTPEEQPALKTLQLPFKLANNQVLDGSRVPLPPDVGVLMVTTTKDSGVPVLVATGNGAEGVSKAVQFLVQSQDRKIGTGQGIIVGEVTEVETPPQRQWPRYLPQNKSFQLSDLQVPGTDKPFKDVTVRGSNAAPIQFDFRALPDDRFTRGSSMTLRYSYGPQVNPRTSAVEVLLDGVFIGGERLNSETGATRKTLNVNLPENLIQPNSKIQVVFRLNPREPADNCGRVTDQQLTGTVHADTSFNLNREISVQLPDLKLLQYGFPFAAPQDLSSTAIVLPDAPSSTDLLTLLEFSERLGRLSLADSIQLKVYKAGSFPAQDRSKFNLVGIGIREKFPFSEVFQSGSFKLKDFFSRQFQQGNIQTLPDREGVIKEIISPWNSDRVLLALSAQTEPGLDRVRQLLSKDPWFFQLQGDTALISTNSSNSSAYDADAYNLEFLQDSPQRRIDNTNLLSKISRWLQEHWFLLPTGIVAFALISYGISQLYLKRVADKKGK
ncbi:MAG: cellulose biosynthesis cyclic di-GMP-binding regulatory protein BcsB [Cyanobacteriota bacterium]